MKTLLKFTALVALRAALVLPASAQTPSPAKGGPFTNGVITAAAPVFTLTNGQFLTVTSAPVALFRGRSLMLGTELNTSSNAYTSNQVYTFRYGSYTNKLGASPGSISAIAADGIKWFTSPTLTMTLAANGATAVIQSTNPVPTTLDNYDVIQLWTVQSTNASANVVVTTNRVWWSVFP